MKRSRIYFLICLFIFTGFFYFEGSTQYKGNDESHYFVDNSKSPSPNNSSYYFEMINYLLANKEKLSTGIQKEMYYQSLATFYSFLGNYKKTEEIISEEIKRINPKYDKVQEDIFENYDTISVNNFLNSLSDSIRCIFFNESHLRPQHRMTIKNSLEILRKKGFQFLFCETLTALDSTLNERGYPNIKSGYFSFDPVYGNLIREAVALNYTIYPYDIETFDTSNKDRETVQADNIIKVLNDNPGAKIIVIVGHQHIFEDRRFGRMASIFKLKTNIDPLTINQDFMEKYQDSTFSNGVFKLFSEKYSIEHPVILVKKDYSPYSFAPTLVDAIVFHPDSDYIDGRPHWLLNKDVKRVYIDKAEWNITDTCIIQAFNQSEDITTAIPIDQILIENFNDNFFLALPSGGFVVRKLSKNGEELLRKTISLN